MEYRGVFARKITQKPTRRGVQPFTKSVTFLKGTFFQQIAHPTHHTNIVVMRVSRHSLNTIFAKICTSWEGVQADSLFVQFFGSAKAANPCRHKKQNRCRGIKRCRSSCYIFVGRCLE